MQTLTASYIFDRLVPKFIEEQPQFAKRVGAVVSIVLEGDGGGSWTIDLTETPRAFRGWSDKAKCTIFMRTDDFNDLVARGTLRDWLTAFKQKKIDFKGHLPTVLKLERLFVAAQKDPVLAEFARRAVDGMAGGQLGIRPSR